MKKLKVKNSLYNSVKSLIEEAKRNIVRNVNSIIVYTYFEIGQNDSRDEQKGKYRADYAKKVLEQLSIQLTTEFGKGFKDKPGIH